MCVTDVTLIMVFDGDAHDFIFSELNFWVLFREKGSTWLKPGMLGCAVAKQNEMEA